MKNSSHFSKLRKRILGEKRGSKPSKPQSRRLLMEPLEARRLLTGDVLELSSLDGINGFRLDGVAAGDRSGWSVSSAGDVNGDDFDDLCSYDLGKRSTVGIRLKVPSYLRPVFPPAFGHLASLDQAGVSLFNGKWNLGC